MDRCGYGCERERVELLSSQFCVGWIVRRVRMDVGSSWMEN